MANVEKRMAKTGKEYKAACAAVGIQPSAFEFVGVTFSDGDKVIQAACGKVKAAYDGLASDLVGKKDALVKAGVDGAWFDRFIASLKAVKPSVISLGVHGLEAIAHKQGIKNLPAEAEATTDAGETTVVSL